MFVAASEFFPFFFLFFLLFFREREREGERRGRRKFLVGEPVTMLFLKHEQNGASVATRYVVVEKRGIRFRGCCNCAFNRCIDA